MKLVIALALLLGLQAQAVIFKNSSDALLGNHNKIKCGSGITCSLSSGFMSMTASPSFTLDSAEVLSNLVDDVVDIASNDSDIVFSLTSPLASNGDATLRLIADASADSGDEWDIVHDGATNSLLFQNDTSGSQVTKLTLATTGIMTMVAAITLSDAETLSNPADDTVRVASNDAAIVLEAYTPGTSDADATLKLTADASADNGDEWDIVHDGGTNSLLFQNDTSGSAVTKLALSTAGAITAVGDITGDGGDQFSGFLQAQIASTTAGLTAAQCGSTVVSNSADTMTLPEASTVLGCRFTFVCGTADDFLVDTDGTDVIGNVSVITGTNTTVVLAPAAGDRIQCTDLGASITLEATLADLWVAVGAPNGVWTDQN